jgi:hypothetical protein
LENLAKGADFIGLLRTKYETVRLDLSGEMKLSSRGQAAQQKGRKSQST